VAALSTEPAAAEVEAAKPAEKKQKRKAKAQDKK